MTNSPIAYRPLPHAPPAVQKRRKGKRRSNDLEALAKMSSYPGRESTFESALADKGESRPSDEVARRASLPQCAGRGYSISGYCFQSCGRSEAHSTYSANC